MGIKNINKLIQKHAQDAFFVMPVTMLQGKRIAIDAGCYQYASISIARKNVVAKTNILAEGINEQEVRREWIMAAVKFILDWLSSGITPVFVFDGKSLPEKKNTKEDRALKRAKAKTEIDVLYSQIRDPSIPCNGHLVEKLRKKLSNYNLISDEEFELFRMIIEGIGVPCLQAVADAERLCASLCVEGKVAAVYSIDTDNYVLGTPLMITGSSKTFTYESGNKVRNLNCVRLDKILEGLNLSHRCFVDMCIMIGCDFNDNIPNIALGSYDIIKRFGSIDNLPKHIYNITCLNHLRCREIFSFLPSAQLILNKLQLDINKDALITARDRLSFVNAGSQMERIINVYRNVVPGQNGHILGLESKLVHKLERPTIILNILPTNNATK